MTDLFEQMAEINPNALFLTGVEFNDAIMGVVERCGMTPVALYDTDKIIAVLVSKGMDQEGAEEYFNYNILGAYMGEDSPMFFRKI